MSPKRKTKGNNTREVAVAVLFALAVLASATYIMWRLAGPSIVQGLAAVAGVSSDTAAEERAKKPVPVLTAEQRYIFEMFGLDAKQIVPFTKFGPITSRFTNDFPNQPLQTYFYQADANGTLNPIGHKRTYRADGYESTAWTQIMGRGEIARLWNKYVDATGILVRTDRGFSMLRSHLVKNAMAVYSPSTTTFNDNEVVIATLHGIQAVRGNIAATPAVKKANLDAQKQDKDAQMYCEDHVYLLENIVDNHASTTRSIEFDLVSTVGGDYAFPKYGFAGIQRLHRYHVSSAGVVTSVTAEPANGAAYSIKDWDNCEFKQ